MPGLLAEVGAEAEPHLLVGLGQRRVGGPGADGVDADPLLEQREGLPGHVGADRLLGVEVVGVAVLDRPGRARVEVGRVEVVLDLGEVRLPAQTGGRGDEADGRAARQHPARQHAVDQVPVSDEVDLLDARRAVGHPGTGEQRVHRAAALVDGGVDGVPVGQVHVDGLRAGQLHLGEVHHHDLGTGVLHELGRGRAHARGATDHQDPLPVVAECIEQCHVCVLLMNDVAS